MYNSHMKSPHLVHRYILRHDKKVFLPVQLVMIRKHQPLFSNPEIQMRRLKVVEVEVEVVEMLPIVLTLVHIHNRR